MPDLVAALEQQLAVLVQSSVEPMVWDPPYQVRRVSRPHHHPHTAWPCAAQGRQMHPPPPRMGISVSDAPCRVCRAVCAVCCAVPCALCRTCTLCRVLTTRVRRAPSTAPAAGRSPRGRPGCSSCVCVRAAACVAGVSVCIRCGVVCTPSPLYAQHARAMPVTLSTLLSPCGNGQGATVTCVT